MAGDSELPIIPEALALGLHDDILIQHLGDESGRGRGVVVQRHFSRGEQILREIPLILISSTPNDELSAAEDGSLDALINGRLQECSCEDSKSFWDLEDCRSAEHAKTATGIFLTNQMEVSELSGGDELVGEGALNETGEEQTKVRKGVFLVGSLFNHSCTPNVFWSERADLGEIVFHALRDIDVGEELTIAYSQALLSMPASIRLDFLRRWSFTCNCYACGAIGENKSTSDKRRALLNLKIRQLGSGQAMRIKELGNDEEIENMRRKIVEDPLQGLQVVRELHALLDEELFGHAPTKSWAALEGFVLAERADREDLALEMLELGLTENCVAEGDDSENSLALAELLAQRKGVNATNVKTIAAPKVKPKRGKSRPK